MLHKLWLRCISWQMPVVGAAHVFFRTKRICLCVHNKIINSVYYRHFLEESRVADACRLYKESVAYIQDTGLFTCGPAAYVKCWRVFHENLRITCKFLYVPLARVSTGGIKVGCKRCRIDIQEVFTVYGMIFDNTWIWNDYY